MFSEKHLEQMQLQLPHHARTGCHTPPRNSCQTPPGGRGATDREPSISTSAGSPGGRAGSPVSPMQTWNRAVIPSSHACFEKMPASRKCMALLRKVLDGANIVVRGEIINHLNVPIWMANLLQKSSPLLRDGSVAFLIYIMLKRPLPFLKRTNAWSVITSFIASRHVIGMYILFKMYRALPGNSEEGRALRCLLAGSEQRLVERYAHDPDFPCRHHYVRVAGGRLHALMLEPKPVAHVANPVAFDKQQTHFSIAETAVPILLIHGGAGGAATWIPCMSTLAANGHIVAALDLPHCGRSTAYIPFRPHSNALGSGGTMPAEAESEAALCYFLDAIDAFRDGMGWTQMIIVGHESGGYVFKIQTQTTFTLRVF